MRAFTLRLYVVPLLSGYPAWNFADALSYVKYAFIGVSLNENMGLVLTCLPTDKGYTLANPNGCFTVAQGPKGANINAFYGYNRYTIEFCAGVMIAYIIVARLIAYLGLRFVKI
jgi:ATP-binding cassette subfamily G (WHITE) protein 2